MLTKYSQKLKQVAQPTLKINDLGRDPMRDPVEMITMPKKRRNTTPLQSPEQFGDIVYFGIVYGSGTSIGGYRYSLLLVDRRSKHIEQYSFKSLAYDDIFKALRLFYRDMGGRCPNKMIGDLDFKLIGG